MSITRTRIARLTAVSAVVVSLGALTAGPAAAQGGKDIGSTAVGVGWAAGDDDTTTNGVGKPGGINSVGEDAAPVSASEPAPMICRYLPCAGSTASSDDASTDSQDETSFTLAAGEDNNTDGVGRGGGVHGVEDPSSVTFASDDDATSTTAVTFAAGEDDYIDGVGRGSGIN